MDRRPRADGSSARKPGRRSLRAAPARPTRRATITKSPSGAERRAIRGDMPAPTASPRHVSRNVPSVAGDAGRDLEPVDARGRRVLVVQPARRMGVARRRQRARARAVRGDDQQLAGHEVAVARDTLDDRHRSTRPATRRRTRAASRGGRGSSTAPPSRSRRTSRAAYQASSAGRVGDDDDDRIRRRASRPPTCSCRPARPAANRRSRGPGARPSATRRRRSWSRRRASRRAVRSRMSVVARGLGRSRELADAPRAEPVGHLRVLARHHEKQRSSRPATGAGAPETRADRRDVAARPRARPGRPRAGTAPAGGASRCPRGT